MKKITLIALVLIAAISCKKKVAEPKYITEFTIQSSNTSGSYKIKIVLPENYDPQHEKYATIYVLDGEDNLNFVAENCKKLSEKYAKKENIVISIGYGRDRAVDYTPSNVKQGKGGAQEFMQFIHDELIPRVENEVAADTTRNSRVLLGHSFGGLFCAYAFTKDNDVFGNYLMLSPSLWYDNEILFDFEKEVRDVLKDQIQLVFLGIGELENAGRMQAPFKAFYHALTKYYPGTKLLKNSVPHLDHMGSKNPNIEKALEFYFQNK